MWVVFPENASGSGESERYRLLVGRAYTVGRKDCDITILNDQSISRRHAELFVAHHETSLGHPHKLPLLSLKDTSKLGTMIGEGRVCGSTKPLNSGDVLLFGTLGTSKYKVVYEPYNVTASCLDPPTKKAVKKHVLQLGGHLVNDWRKDCQLLVMSSLSVTVKVICAMISQKTVVTPTYLVDLIKALETKAKEPDPADYIPTLAESQLDPNEVSFRKDERRRTLFQGKIFVFLQPKQFKKLSMAIELAGGMPMLMEEGTDDNEDDILVRTESCVMYCDAKDDVQGLSQNAQEWVRHVETVLKRHKKRFINDSEIGYAVLFCCTDKYCNPDVDLGPSPSGKSGLPSQSLSQSRDFSMSQLENTAPQQPSTSRESRVRGNQKTPKLAEPLVQTIKEEPLSQPSSSRVETDTVKDVVGSHKKQAATARSSRKRGRAADEAEDEEEEEEEESRQTRKSAKRDVFEFQSQASIQAPLVKTERITPRKGTKTVAADSKASRSTRQLRNRSRSKSPSPGPDPGPGPSTRQTRAASRSPSPKPSRHKKSGKQNSPTANQSKQPSKFKQEPVADSLEDTESRPPSKRGHTQRNIWDSDEDEDNEGRDRDSDNDPFADNRFARSSNVTKKAKKEVASTSVDRNKGEREDRDTGRGDVGIPVKKSPATPRGRHSTRTAESIPPSPPRNEDYAAADGFLSKPTGGGAGVKSEDIDPTLPVNVVVTECVSLVARRPEQTRKAKRTTGSVTMWNGKQVPNFKKFRKTTNAGDSDLPQIIGGSDLVVYTGSGTKEQDNMFAEALQMESQQAEQDRRAKDLFSWEPPTNKKTRRGRH